MAPPLFVWKNPNCTETLSSSHHLHDPPAAQNLWLIRIEHNHASIMLRCFCQSSMHQSSSRFRLHPPGKRKSGTDQGDLD